MAYELNLDYLWNNDRAKIIAAEAAFALVGFIINGVWGGLAKGLLSFTFFTTMVISGSIVLLNVVKLYEKLHEAIGNLLVQIEECYIGIWIFFYVVCTILGLISWGLGNLVGYVELGLFVGHGIFHYQSLKNPSETPQNSPEETESQDESENELNIDFPQSA
jgi:hypothetical protein